MIYADGTLSAGMPAADRSGDIAAGRSANTVPPLGAAVPNHDAELTRRFDGSAVLGYLNFSDGRTDAKFRKSLADAFGGLLELGEADPRGALHRWLSTRAAELEQSGSAAFRDLSQAKAIVDLGLRDIPGAYRAHHRDLLAHQPDARLFNPFFLARSCETALTASDASPEVHVRRLNDFVGYRPIALLETRPQNEFYAHEQVAPVPLYFKGIGPAPGPYADIIRPALDLLEKTDPGLLDDASFDPARLEEIALDPRAIDHFHPVNKRPSVLFGEWDPHRIDGRGYYTRFVLRQSTLDALLRWIFGEKWPNTTGLKQPNSERLFESAAALCGTILMGAGVSGSGPTFHDSTVTLSGLVGRIARYRDDFYKRLLIQTEGPHGERLREESTRYRQPFAMVRQYLNSAIASERALHLQERRLALLFASMGYPEAARRRSANIPAPATRFGTEIRLRQTEAQFAAEQNRPADAARMLSETEDLLKRGIDCGAMIDPWNILGYQGLFPIFPGRDDTVRDPRAEDLILTVGRQFELYAQALSVAAAGPDRGSEERLRIGMQKLAGWWDRFATVTVTDMPRVQGSERTDAAEHVARATALWRSGGAGDPAFWRKHRDGFRTPAAYSQVIDALLNQNDDRAAMALLVTWLSEADAVPLQDPSASFFRLSFRWLRSVTSSTDSMLPAERGPLVRRFFELLEVNADIRWHVPDLGLAPLAKKPKLSDDVEDLLDELDDEDLELNEDDLEGEDEDADDDDNEDDDDEDEAFSSAYEGMSFKDSADDGIEGAVADDGPSFAGDFALDGEADEAEDRLRFLAAVARLWRTAARPDLWERNDSAAMSTAGEWLRMARQNLVDLAALTERLYRITIPEPTAGVEGVMEFDRRRAVRGSLLDLAVQTSVETTSAARALAALLSKSGELTGTMTKVSPTADIPGWEPIAVKLERAVAVGDRAAVRKLLPGFITLFRNEPLLVCPPTDGGKPGPALRAQAALHMVESLLARLPRLGLLRETYQLLKLSRIMERNEPPEGRRVSSFDQLFRTAVLGIVDSLLSGARDWGADAGEDGPTAAALHTMAESFRALWIDHSMGLRLSALETVVERESWETLKEFVRNYGSDLFSVRFLTLSNIRGILAQGAGVWLNKQFHESDEPGKLATDFVTGKVDPEQIAKQFELVLQSLVEHYDEYRDYNTTTTQSDYGENLYILLDFLRLKVAYDRSIWRMRPMILAHEMLCRRGFDRLAANWREEIAAYSDRTAEELLTQLSTREGEHAVKLRTVRDRLEERFLQPLRIDQAAARVARAAQAARDGKPEDNPAFEGLLATIQPLADHPSGVGLDVPAWLRRLEEELRKVRAVDPEAEPDLFEQFPFPEPLSLDFNDLQRQLREWEKPLTD